ncbi:MAG: O-antigen ligase family protein [Ruminococcus sp.]|nr:O-antigen ligase family protein [Ruminococcus sp.]
MPKKIENKKEVKHLFGSTEKSDFILNMTTESAQKMSGVYAIICIVLLCAMAIPYYFTQNIEYGVEESVNRTLYLNEKFIFFISTAVLLTGFVAFIIFLISCMKKQVLIERNKALVLPVLILAATLVSCLLSSETFVAFYGYLDRSEGMLTTIGYWGLFSVGLSVTNADRRLNVSDTFVGFGMFQSLVGVLQAIPATAKIVPNYFKEVFYSFSNDKAGLIFDDRQNLYVTREYIPTGFVCSPHALAAVLTITLAFAMFGVIFAEGRKRMIFCGVGAVLMSAALIMTCTLTGIIGFGAVMLITLVIALIKAGKDKAKKPVAVCLAMMVISGGIFGALAGTGKFRLLDERLIYHDSFYRLSISDVDKNEYGEWIYSYLWDNGMYVAEQKPLFGVGPDNWSEMIQNYGLDTDRSYNEYIDIFMTRGIFTLALTVLFLIVTLIKGFRTLAAFMRGEGKYWDAAVVAALLAYIIQAFFNISSVTSTPYFFLTLGLCWAPEAQGKIKEKEE